MAPDPKKYPELHRLHLLCQSEQSLNLFPGANAALRAFFDAAAGLSRGLGSSAAAEVMEIYAAAMRRIELSNQPKRKRGAPKGPRRPNERTAIREFMTCEAILAGREGREPNWRRVAKFLKETRRLHATEDTIYRRLHREKAMWDAEMKHPADGEGVNLLRLLAEAPDGAEWDK